MARRIIKQDDILSIGFNNPNEEFGDKATLTVVRKVGNEIHILKTLYGERAEKLHAELVDAEFTKPSLEFPSKESEEE